MQANQRGARPLLQLLLWPEPLLTLVGALDMAAVAPITMVPISDTSSDMVRLLYSSLRPVMLLR